MSVKQYQCGVARKLNDIVQQDAVCTSANVTVGELSNVAAIPENFELWLSTRKLFAIHRAIWSVMVLATYSDKLIAYSLSCAEVDKAKPGTRMMVSICIADEKESNR